MIQKKIFEKSLEGKSDPPLAAFSRLYENLKLVRLY